MGKNKLNDKQYESYIEFQTLVADNAINKIKELLFSDESPYIKISMVEGLAMDKAALPERFADKLADMLEKELGIYTQKVPHKNGFGLKVMKLGKAEKKRKNLLF